MSPQKEIGKYFKIGVLVMQCVSHTQLIGDCDPLKEMEGFEESNHITFSLFRRGKSGVNTGKFLHKVVTLEHHSVV